MQPSFEEFLRERNEALLSLDRKKIGKYMKKYKINVNPSNDAVFWAMVHKARCNVLDIPIEEKAKSVKWLHEHGFSENIN